MRTAGRGATSWPGGSTPSRAGSSRIKSLTLAKPLGCVPAGAESAAVRAAVLAELRHRGRWLLIFDNAEAPADVAPWLPGDGGHVLITSRKYGWDEIAGPVGGKGCTPA